MHIILMLVLIMLGVGKFDSSPLIGFALIVAGLFCFLLGDKNKRQDGEALFFSFGLVGIVVVLVANIWTWLTRGG